MREDWKAKFPEPDWVSHCGNAILYNRDCLEVLPLIPEGSVDCTVTSPPYNQRIDSFRPSGFKKGGEWANRIASSYADNLDEEAYQQSQREILNLIHDCTSDGGSMFYNHKCRWRNKVLLHPLAIVLPTHWNIRQEIIWFRDGSLTQNAKMFPPCEERIVWMFKGSTWKWNAESNRFLSVWRLNSEKHTEHPVAYPSAIPERAVEATTSPAATILDPYMGSGTTGVAALRLGRKFIGIEIEPKYFEIAKQRIANEHERFSLFNAAQETQSTLFK